jgi:hypothetical protein
MFFAMVAGLSLSLHLAIGWARLGFGHGAGVCV